MAKKIERRFGPDCGVDGRLFAALCSDYALSRWANRPRGALSHNRESSYQHPVSERRSVRLYQEARGGDPVSAAGYFLPFGLPSSVSTNSRIISSTTWEIDRSPQALWKALYRSLSKYIPTRVLLDSPLNLTFSFSFFASIAMSLKSIRFQTQPKYTVEYYNKILDFYGITGYSGFVSTVPGKMIRRKSYEGKTVPGVSRGPLADREKEVLR